MNVSIGGNRFNDVSVPVLWGHRAIIQHGDGDLSVIDLRGTEARPEIVAGSPAEGVEFRRDGALITVIRDGMPSFQLDTSSQTISDSNEILLPCTIGHSEILIGSNRFSNNTVASYGVGLIVTSTGFSMGAPLPEGLAELVV